SSQRQDLSKQLLGFDHLTFHEEQTGPGSRRFQGSRMVLPVKLFLDYHVLRHMLPARNVSALTVIAATQDSFQLGSYSGLIGKFWTIQSLSRFIQHFRHGGLVPALT